MADDMAADEMAATMSEPTAKDASTPPLLTVRDLRTSFDTPGGVVRAVDGVSFDLERGETIGIVGESGSGKSVLVRSIMNLLPASALAEARGEVLFEQRDVRQLTGPAARHLWGHEIAMVFQNPMTSLNPVRRIGTQITESLRFHLGMSRRAATERAAELLGQLGIPAPTRRLDQYPHELSGGMRQRIMIAIAIACEPKLLIVDEPTTALDVIVQKQILDLLAELQRIHRMAMILISHDLGVVGDYSSKVAVMYAGRFVETAPTEQIFTEVRHPYTNALLQSIPRVDQPSHTRLAAIGGRPPSIVGERVGCSFAPRCSRATEECTHIDPEMLGTATHGYRCIHPIGLDAVASDAPKAAV